MTRAAAAPLVDLQAGWSRKAGELRSWSALTGHGAVMVVTATEGGWDALVDPPWGLWELTAVTSEPLPTRARAQEWAEQTAARHDW